MSPDEVPNVPKPNDLVPALIRSLNPKTGVVPLLVIVVYLGIYLALMFDLVPREEIAWGLIGVLGPVVGLYIRHEGRQ